MNYKLEMVISKSDWQSYHQIRREVLWDARNKVGYNNNHTDEFASNNLPLLLKFKDRPIGTIRLDNFENGTGAIRLLTIALDMQKNGHGKKLIELTEIIAKNMNIHTLFVNAAPEAVGFYKKLGWEHFLWNKSELTDVSADCQQMRKILVQNMASFSI